MTKTIDAKFEEPNQKNVEVGDFVIDIFEQFPEIFEVSAVGRGGVAYRKYDNRELTEIPFSATLVLKRDRTKYLIGKELSTKINFDRYKK